MKLVLVSLNEPLFWPKLLMYHREEKSQPDSAAAFSSVHNCSWASDKKQYQLSLIQGLSKSIQKIYLIIIVLSYYLQMFSYKTNSVFYCIGSKFLILEDVPAGKLSASSASCV